MEEPQIFTLDNAGPTPVSCTNLCSVRLSVDRWPLKSERGVQFPYGVPIYAAVGLWVVQLVVCEN